MQLVLVGRTALGGLLGYLIGLERAYRGKDAGDRTFSLLALGSAAFVGVGIELFPFSADRVIQGVAAGVGFLGAGIIFRAGGETRGLTTAAASWAASAVGVCAGTGLYITAVASAALTIVLLESHQVEFLRRLARRTGAPDDPDDP
jgi:putative Mg2+ transporter-C (MgtC) family protein